MLFVTNLLHVKQLYQSQNSKTHALFRPYVLLRYVLIYNLGVFFNFHLTFLQLNVVKMFTACAVETVRFLTSGYFLRAPDNSNCFRFPLKVRVIGSSKKIAGSKETNSFYCTCSEHFNHI